MRDIVIRITIPEGAMVSVDTQKSVVQAAAEIFGKEPTADDVAFRQRDEIPWPEEAPVEAVEPLSAPEPTQVVFPPIGSKNQPPVCPVHHNSKFVPAGTSKAGNPFDAFWSCKERDCTAGKNGKGWTAPFKAAA